MGVGRAPPSKVLPSSAKTPRRQQESIGCLAQQDGDLADHVAIAQQAAGQEVEVRRRIDKGDAFDDLGLHTLGKLGRQGRGVLHYTSPSGPLGH